MRLLARILVILAFCFADAFFGFAFYLRWNKYEYFGKDLIHYSFAHSMFELWLFSTLRVVVLLGALVILFDSNDGMKIIKIARYPVGFVNIFMVIFTLVKIMLYTEYLDGDHDDDVWFLSLGAWTMVASLAMYAIWVHILQKEEPTDKETTELKMRLNKKGKMVKSKNASNGSDSYSDDSDDADNDDDDDADDDADNGRRDKEKKQMEENSTLFKLLSYSAPDWPILLVAFASLIAATVGKVFLPRLIGHVLDGMVIKESKEKPHLREPMIYMALISIGVAVTNGLRSGFFTLTSARLNRRITKSLFGSILSQELGFFDKNTTGAITSCLIADIATMSDMLGIKINICLQSIFELVGNLIFMILISWRLTIITIVTFPLLSIIADVFGSYSKNLSATIQSTLAAANKVAGEAISTMTTVRSFANEEGEKKSYGNKLYMTYLLRKKGAAAAAVAKVFSSVFTLMMFVGTLFYGGHLVRRKMISGGMLVSYILYHQAFGSCLESLAGSFADLMMATGASTKVLQLIKRTPKLSNEGKLAPRSFEGHLEFKNVSFAYPTEPSIPVLKDVSFKAHPGEVLALVGPSGGGKSSCISLIEHFYEPTSGEVLIDGRNVKDYDHSYLHEKVSLVGQEPVLYARSILENISYSLKNCSMERIKKAARQANAHKFIMRLKKGYKTEAGEKGLQLSGGQKQRVAIARALVRNPQILLLDEATSALDAQSEYVVQKALTKNFGNRTVIIVAHRLSTIEKADRIVVIDQGKVVEQGRHQDLISSEGLYAALVRRQLRGLGKGGDVTEAEVERRET